MARKPRINVVGGVHHVMAHAMDGKSLFSDTRDRRKFLSLLAEGLNRTGFRCYAWSLMDSHYHLVIRINEKPLAELMRTLNSTYARHYNMRHKRRGYVFQDRYRSLAAGDQRYVHELLRYVHLNPVRAGICSSLKELDVYPWTGHAALMGTIPNGFQNTGVVLRRFGPNPVEGRKPYCRFLQEGLCGESDDDIVPLIRRSNAQCGHRDDPSCWVIGDHAFVAEAIRRDRENRMRLSRLKRQGWTLQRLGEHVARRLGLDPSLLGRPAPRGAYAQGRSALAALAYRTMGVAQTKIAQCLGVTGAAVSKMTQRGEPLVEAYGLGVLPC